MLFSAACFFISPYGGILCLAFFIILITFLILIGDKMLLAAMEAESLDYDNHLVSIVKNLSCHFEIEDVSLFRSARLRSNLYFLSGPSGKSSIVLGDDLLDILSREELKAILDQALCMIKKGEGWPRVFANLLFIPFCFLFSKKHKKYRFGRPISAFSFFL